MFKLIRDNRNISTKNLYIGKLGTFHIKFHTPERGIQWVEGPKTPKKVIVKETSKTENYIKKKVYVDIFTKTKYLLYGDHDAEDGSIVIFDLQPVWTTESHIKYKDAEELFENMNKPYIKKK